MVGGSTPTYNYSSSTGGGGGSSTPSYDAQELRQLDQQKSLYERLLRSADSTLSSGLNSLSDSYNQQRNRANQDRLRELNILNRQRQESESGREQALNQVGDNSRVLRNSLMNMLGLASGGGSAFQLADRAVAREATKNRSNVLEDYSQNFTNLQQSEDDAKTAFDRLLDDLASQRNDREEALRSGVASQRQGLNATLAEIAADRARLMGGDQFSAASPYRQQYNSLQDTIDGLSDRFRTQVDYNKVDLKPTTLRDYVVNRAGIGGQAPGPQQQYSPYQNFLQRDQEEEERLA